MDCDRCGTTTVRVVDGEWTRWHCPDCDRITHREFGGAETGSVLWHLRRAVRRSVRESLTGLRCRLRGHEWEPCPEAVPSKLLEFPATSREDIAVCDRCGARQPKAIWRLAEQQGAVP